MSEPPAPSGPPSEPATAAAPSASGAPPATDDADTDADAAGTGANEAGQIGKKAAAGIRWNLLGSLASQLIRVIVIAALGRLLTDADFGVVAAAMTVVLLANLIRDAGIGRALIQRRDITDDHLATSFALSLGIGAVLAAATFLLATPIADLYRQPAAAEPLRALSALFVLRGLSSTANALAQRRMQFRALALIDVIGYFIGSAVMVGAALLGLGWWSLVLGYLVEGAAQSLLVLRVAPPGVWPRWSRHAFADLFGFGSGQTLAGIANWVATQGDYVVVGRNFDAGTLGAYTRAYDIMRFPAKTFTNIAGKVLFASFARLQDQPHQLADAFCRSLTLSAMVLLPASAGLIVLAPEAIRIMLGPGWDHAVVPFQIMATSMMFRTSYKSASMVARSAGDVFAIAWAQGLYAVAVVGGAALSARWGIAGVAATTAAAVALHFLNLTRLAKKHLPVSWADVVRAHAPGVTLALITTAAAWPAAVALRQASAHTAVVAVVVSAVGGVVGLGFVGWQVRRGSPSWRWAVQAMRSGTIGKRKKKAKRRAAQ